jgi:glycine dehydrogenase subunit 1
MSLLGAEGLRRTAIQCHSNTQTLARALAGLPGVSLAFETFFHEAVLVLDCPVAPILAKLADNNIVGGYDLSLSYPELGNALLVCATDVRNADEITAYRAAMQSALENSKAA